MAANPGEAEGGGGGGDNDVGEFGFVEPARVKNVDVVEGVEIARIE